MQLVLATNNRDKIKEIRHLLDDLPVTILTADDFLEFPDIEETGTTLAENALLKARAYHSARLPLVFGGDAGLEIDALNGEPGVQVRRWNGRFADDVDDQTWLAYLLQRLEGLPQSMRTARWVAAWGVITPDGTEHVRHVRHEFMIAQRPLRPILDGSPMSAVELHSGDHLAYRQAWIADEWAQWGLLDRIVCSP